MKKFRFSLHSVAVQRKLKEDEKRERFAAAVGAQAFAEQAVERIEGVIRELEQTIASARAGHYRPADQVSFLQALATERARLTQAISELAKARAAVDVARQAWIEARRDVRLIDTLESKARAAHRQAWEREEQATLDDRVNALLARNA